MVHPKRLKWCLRFLNDLKSARLVVWSPSLRCEHLDGWTCEKHKERPLLSLVEKDESARTLSTTRHPAPIKFLHIVALNGAGTPPIGLSMKYRLTTRDYEDNLGEKKVLWTNSTFDTTFVTAALQMDVASAYTSYRVQRFLQEQNLPFWTKNIWRHSCQTSNNWTLSFGRILSPRHANVVIQTKPSWKHPLFRNGWHWAWTSSLPVASASDSVLKDSMLQGAVLSNKWK